jgi:hypothetical protein
MVLVPNPDLETFPICCKKYSLIFYLRQTNRYARRKLPDVHAWQRTIKSDAKQQRLTQDARADML